MTPVLRDFAANSFLTNSIRNALLVDYLDYHAIQAMGQRASIHHVLQTNNVLRNVAKKDA